jgi:hypothetical protein
MGYAYVFLSIVVGGLNVKAALAIAAAAFYFDFDLYFQSIKRVGVIMPGF